MRAAPPSPLLSPLSLFGRPLFVSLHRSFHGRSQTRIFTRNIFSIFLQRFSTRVSSGNFQYIGLIDDRYGTNIELSEYTKTGAREALVLGRVKRSKVFEDSPVTECPESVIRIQCSCAPEKVPLYLKLEQKEKKKRGVSAKVSPFFYFKSERKKVLRFRVRHRSRSLISCPMKLKKNNALYNMFEAVGGVIFFFRRR